jgi:hypothetical protein
MKPNFKILIIAAFLALAPLLTYAPPPHVGQNPPEGGPVGPAGAPIGNGTVILLTLSAAYALRKVYVMRTAKEEATE